MYGEPGDSNKDCNPGGDICSSFGGIGDIINNGMPGKTTGSFMSGILKKSGFLPDNTGESYGAVF